MLLPALPSASGPFVGPGDRYPNRQLKTKSVPVWLLADSQPHSLHSLKRFFWRRSIVINHFGSKGASPALPSAPPCTEARRGPILARKRWASGIAASTLSSSGAGPNPCSPTTKPEFPDYYQSRFAYFLYPRKVIVFDAVDANQDGCGYLAVFRDTPRNLASEPFAGRWNQADLGKRLSGLEPVQSGELTRIYRVP